jgi:predicted membrane protein
LPYCRKCGARLDEDSRFCYRCGTAVSAPPRVVYRSSLRKDPLVLGAAVIVAAVVFVIIVSGVVYAPLYDVNFDQTFQDTHPDVKQLNLNFQASTAQVNVEFLNMTGSNIAIEVYAKGSRGFLGSANPVNVTFTNETSGDTLTVNSKVTLSNQVFTRNLQLVCTIYINPALNLNLNVTSQTGDITLNSDSSATFQSLHLKTETGSVVANFGQDSVIAGDASLSTQTGSVHFRFCQASVCGNATVNLASTLGSADVDVMQSRMLGGNLAVNAATTTGSINVNLQLDGDVAAKIISLTNIGNIRFDKTKEGFSGDNSQLQSTNYPAADSNVEINSKVNGVGDVNIVASYQSAVTKNQT